MSYRMIEEKQILKCQFSVGIQSICVIQFAELVKTI